LLLNELAQWAVLAFMGIFVLGLTRQLADFLVPPRELLADARGPAIGKKLPDDVLPPRDRSRLLELLEERGSTWAAMVVVSAECPHCRTLLEGIIARGAPGGAPIVALSSEGDAEHEALLNQAADVVVLDGDRLVRNELTIKPFVLLVDRALRVQRKQITDDLHEVVASWAGSRDALAGDGSIEVVQVGSKP